MEVTKPIKVGNVWTNLISGTTGESVNYEEVTEWFDGTPIDDSKVDGTIYRKLPASVGGGYVKRAYRGQAKFDWFNPDNTGNSDVTEVFQRAVQICPELYVSKGTYLVSGTILISSNRVIHGEIGTVIKGVFTVEGEGGYPTTIFQNKNTEEGDVSIRISNLTLDYGREITQATSGVGLTTNPGINFRGVVGLQITNCSFINYITNRDTDLTGYDRAVKFCLASFENCSNILITNVHTEFVREEGFVFFYCNSIRISDWEGIGTGGQSSMAAFWYCDGVRVENSNFRQNSGSVINVYSTNVVISNISQNKGEPRWGRGVDIGNEVGVDEDFIVSNITIENSYFNCFSYGVGTGLGSSETQPLNNIHIVNNTFDVNEQTSGGLLGYHRCIVISNPNGWLISNNNIRMRATTGATQGVAFSLRTDNVEDTSSGVTISDNSVDCLTFFSVVLPSSVGFINRLKNLVIKNNRFTSIAPGSLNTQSGASHFIYIRDQQTSQGELTIENIIVQNNVGEEIYGGLYYEFLQSPLNTIITKSVIIDSNSFYGPISGRMSSPIRMRNAGRIGGGDNVGVFRVTSNNIYRGRGMRISRQKELIFSNNVIDYQEENLLLVQLDVEEVSDCVKVNNNFFKNIGSSFNVVNEINPSVPSMFVDISDNIAYTNDGTPFFNTNFTNSFKLNTDFVSKQGANLSSTDGTELVGTPITGSILAVIVSTGTGYPTVPGTAYTFNRSTLRGCFSLFRASASTNSNLYLQCYDEDGLGLGWVLINPTAQASADTASMPGGTYSQSEVQSILTELRDLKTKMRAVGLLVT